MKVCLMTIPVTVFGNSSHYSCGMFYVVIATFFILQKLQMEKKKKMYCKVLKGRFLEFQMYHNFANLFSELLKSTFYKEKSKFQ